MAECYKRSYGNSSRRRDLKRNSSKHKSVHESGKKFKTENVGSKTPPLPTVRDYSIEELLERKKIIQKTLERINHKPKKLNKSYKEEKKYRYTNRDKKYDESTKNNITNELKFSSPIFNQDHIHHSESEDEDYIIEQRRKQRRELLEQLTGAEIKTSLNEDNNLLKSSYVNHEILQKDVFVTKNKANKNETADMFSEGDDFSHNKKPEGIIQDNNENGFMLADNWDDTEGYYKVLVGDCINKNRYTVKAILGQGVFANVVRAQDNNNKSQDVAIKIIRNNDLMQKTGLKEISILEEINKHDPEDKYHCIKLLCHFFHKRHLCLVFEPYYMDMRSVLKKYGKHNGINLKALMSYSRQLLVALKLLSKIGIIHADIKPDNILINEKKNLLKLCDFGSAAKIHESEPTPYLVSRFYRAPEIILGIPYSYGVDIWSTACTIYEMATNKILFTGASNNKMLKCFMDLKGKIPYKLLKKGKFKDQHFNNKNNFLLRKKDKVTDRDKIVEIGNIDVSRDLLTDLKKYFQKLSLSEEKKLLQLKDLLEKMLVLDEKHRLSVSDCLKHSFIQVQLK